VARTGRHACTQVSERVCQCELSVLTEGFFFCISFACHVEAKWPVGQLASLSLPRLTR
jgi:hypothetical protein